MLTPEERRKKNREYKANQRARERQRGMHAVPTGADASGDHPDTSGDHGGDEPAKLGPVAHGYSLDLETLEIPPGMLGRKAEVMALAAVLDDASRASSFANISARLDNLMTALRKASKPKEKGGLELLRDKFPQGGAGGNNNQSSAGGKKTAGG